MLLYDYFRSTASYRVRIALEIKQLIYEKTEVHLVNNGGEQHKENYKNLNPQALIPTLVDNEKPLSQSIAIIEYLDECHPTPPLLPETPFDKAMVRSLSLAISCDIHPLNNLRVLQYLQKILHVSDEEKTTWYHHWLQLGFDAIETQLHSIERKQDVCFGDTVTMADCCLIPQVYNAHRFKFSMDAYPLINAINDYCLSLDAFQKAAPEPTT